MIKISNRSIANAETIYAVANTPMYIARNLRLDPSVVELSRQHTSDEIVDAIDEIISKSPDDTRERVLPFILITALAIKQDVRSLRRFEGKDFANYRWLRTFVDTLVKTATPTNTSSISMQRPALTSSRSSTRTNAPAAYQTFVMKRNYEQS